MDIIGSRARNSAADINTRSRKFDMLTAPGKSIDAIIATNGGHCNYARIRSRKCRGGNGPAISGRRDDYQASFLRSFYRGLQDCIGGTRKAHVYDRYALFDHPIDSAHQIGSGSRNSRIRVRDKNRSGIKLCFRDEPFKTAILSYEN
ncbi:hypothetical protein ASS64_15400 [Erythrobacter sp. AP23]|nr:hypothetical protein ASS64_15400 [Erythrobacter sp. AP23]